MDSLGRSSKVSHNIDSTGDFILDMWIYLHIHVDYIENLSEREPSRQSQTQNGILIMTMFLMKLIREEAKEVNLQEKVKIIQP